MTLLEIQLRRDTAANWTTNNPILLAGEPGWESDTRKFKIGDGTTSWVNLPYSPAPAPIPGASAHLSPSGGDDSAAMVNALTNFVPFVSPLVVLDVGTFRWNTQVPAFVRNTPGSVIGAGEDQTFIQLSSAAPRAFDFGKVADNDTFPSITLKGFTVNNNGLGSGDHVVIGTLQAGSFQTRISVTNLTVENVNTINVPVSATGAYQRRSISIVVKHLADNETTQHRLTDILIKDCDFAGGAYGAQVGGTSPGNSANVLYDRVWFVRVKHDTLVTPTAAMGGNGANLFIGSAAQGGTCGIIDCYGANSCDVGIEIDNATNGYVSPSTEIVDAWNVNFFTRNFRAPVDLDAQTVEMNGIARNVNIDPTTGGPSVQHFAVGGDSTTAAYVFGHVIFGNCRSVFETSLANASLSGLSVGVKATQVRRITVRTLTVAARTLAANPTATANPTFVDLRSAYATASVRVESIHFRLDGTRSGVNAIGWKMVRIAGPVRFEVQNITHDIAGLSGIGANDTFYWLLLDDGLTSTLDGSIRGIKALSVPVGGTHYGVFVTGTGTLTIPGTITIDGCDLANLPTGGLDYRIDATQTAKIRINGWLTARGTGHGPLQAATAITLGASPYTYANADGINEQVTIVGGTVSSVVLGQGGNVTVANVGTYLLRPGDTLVVTYTAAPTMTKSPAV